MNSLSFTTALSTRRAAFVALALTLSAGAALAHPALAEPAVASIDPNTFIVGHPASPTVRGGHANFEHPAVLVARRAGSQGIDANTFIVQPPVQVSWTVQPELDAGTRLAAAAAAAR